MKSLAPGARRLPAHHITIRVPWHDSGWTGSVCARPLENTSCLILPRIGEGKRDEVEARCAGQRLDELSAEDLPPCVGERVSFMAPFELTRTMRHPYEESSAETHGHFAPTRFVQPPYSAAWVPQGNIETLQLGAEARELAEAYIAEGVISAKMRADAQHIAIATVARVDVLI